MVLYSLCELALNDTLTQVPVSWLSKKIIQLFHVHCIKKVIFYLYEYVMQQTVSTITHNELITFRLFKILTTSIFEMVRY